MAAAAEPVVLTNETTILYASSIRDDLEALQPKAWTYNARNCMEYLCAIAQECWHDLKHAEDILDGLCPNGTFEPIESRFLSACCDASRKWKQAKQRVLDKLGDNITENRG